MGERKGRVLIVDDEQAVRDTLEALLEDDFDVVSAASAERAEALLKKQPFDAVLTDFEMPGKSGVELLKTVRQDYPLVMGILLTGHGDHPAVVAAARANEVARVIEKPYDPSRLVKWVDSVVRLARMQASVAAFAARSAERHG